MNAAIPAARRPRIFYGWWIVLAGTINQTISGTFSYYGFSAFFTPLIQEFGWSRAALAGAVSVSRLEGGVLALPVGYLLDRYGPRKLMYFGIIVTGLGYILLSRVNSLAAFYFVFVVLVQGGASFGMGRGVNVAVANWFRRKRGQAMGLITLGLSFGGIAAPLVTWLIETLGWRSATVIAGLVVWSIGLPLAAVVRHKPEPYGYRPDGDPPRPAAATAGAAPAAREELAEEISLTPKQALGSMAFWTVAFTAATRNLVTGSVAVHLIPYLIQDRGMSATTAASVLSMMALVGAPGRVMFGWLGDRYDKRLIMAGCFIFQSVGMMSLNLFPGTIGIILFLTLYAPTYSGVLPLLPAIQADYFGRAFFGTVSGLMSPINLLGTIAGPVLAGYIFDTTGSYSLALTLFAVSNLMSLLFIALTRRPKASVVVAV